MFFPRGLGYRRGRQDLTDRLHGASLVLQRLVAMMTYSTDARLNGQRCGLSRPGSIPRPVVPIPCLLGQNPHLNSKQDTHHVVNPHGWTNFSM